MSIFPWKKHNIQTWQSVCVTLCSRSFPYNYWDKFVKRKVGVFTGPNVVRENSNCSHKRGGVDKNNGNKQIFILYLLLSSVKVPCCWSLNGKLCCMWRDQIRLCCSSLPRNVLRTFLFNNPGNKNHNNDIVRICVKVTPLVDTGNIANLYFQVSEHNDP